MSARGLCVVGALAMVGAAACRTPAGSERLEGRWVGVRAEGVGADSAAAANAFAAGTTLEFRRNALFVTTPRESQAGRYSVLEEEPSTVVVTTDRDGPAHPQTFTFTGDDRMRWNLYEAKSIVFARE